MIVAQGPVEIAAFMARVVDGNHNNAMLIDRVLERVAERLQVVSCDVFSVCCDVAYMTGAETLLQKHRRAAMVSE